MTSKRVIGSRPDRREIVHHAPARSPRAESMSAVLAAKDCSLIAPSPGVGRFRSNPGVVMFRLVE